MNMKNEMAQHELVKIKLNKQTSKKIQKLMDGEVDETAPKVALQNFTAGKKILQSTDNFFPWLTEELKKLKAEDDFNS